MFVYVTMYGRFMDVCGGARGWSIKGSQRHDFVAVELEVGQGINHYSAIDLMGFK